MSDVGRANNYLPQNFSVGCILPSDRSHRQELLEDFSFPDAPLDEFYGGGESNDDRKERLPLEARDRGKIDGGSGVVGGSPRDEQLVTAGGWVPKRQLQRKRKQQRESTNTPRGGRGGRGGREQATAGGRGAAQLHQRRGQGEQAQQRGGGDGGGDRRQSPDGRHHQEGGEFGAGIESQTAGRWGDAAAAAAAHDAGNGGRDFAAGVFGGISSSRMGRQHQQHQRHGQVGLGRPSWMTNQTGTTRIRGDAVGGDGSGEPGNGINIFSGTGAGETRPGSSYDSVEGSTFGNRIMQTSTQFGRGDGGGLYQHDWLQDEQLQLAQHRAQQQQQQTRQQFHEQQQEDLLRMDVVTGGSDAGVSVSPSISSLLGLGADGAGDGSIVSQQQLYTLQLQQLQQRRQQQQQQQLRWHIQQQEVRSLQALMASLEVLTNPAYLVA